MFFGVPTYLFCLLQSSSIHSEVSMQRRGGGGMEEGEEGDERGDGGGDEEGTSSW